MSRYFIFAETNGAECETWYNFIKEEGNKKTLKYLSDQLNDIDMYIIDDFSSFDLDLEYSVSARTAKEMTKVEINHYMFHRKFDGKLKPINLRRKKKGSNYEWIISTHEMLSYGQIENYISDEDVDTEDLTDNEEESEIESDFADSSSNEEIIPPPLNSDSEEDKQKDKKSSKNPKTVENISSGTVLGRPTFASEDAVQSNIPRNKRRKKKKKKYRLSNEEYRQT